MPKCGTPSEVNMVPFAKLREDGVGDGVLPSDDQGSRVTTGGG